MSLRLGHKGGTGGSLLGTHAHVRGQSSNVWPWPEGLLRFHLPETQDRQPEDVATLFPRLPSGTPGEVFRQVLLALGRVCVCIEERDEVPWLFRLPRILCARRAS